jgi:N-acetylneuraminic acid mutarotase
MQPTGEHPGEGPHSHQWQARPALNVPRGGLIGATADTTYAIGGSTSNFGAELASVERLDPVTGRWSLVTPMPTARGNPAAAAARGDVYVLGGFVNDKTVDIVEIFDPPSGQWRSGRPLPEARGGAGAAAIGDRIYVVGGFDAVDTRTAAVFVYDVSEDAWHGLRPMPTPRGLLKVAVLDGHLYAIGGADDNLVFQDAVERYDPATDTWRTAAPLQTPRGNPGVATSDRHIFVVGGATADGPSRTSEEYDPHPDRWRPLSPLLPVGRASLSATLLDGAHGHDHTLVAFGGFERAGGPPIASARVEALSLNAH